VFAHSSRSLLTHRDFPRFPEQTLFHRVARAVCEANCLPRKELYESWEVARRVRRKFRGGRVVDLACGHGLTAQLLLILDATSPEAIAVDSRLSPSAGALSAALAQRWPVLASRVAFRESELGGFELTPEDVVVSVHACGALTDLVLARAIGARARVAVLPCCHDASQSDTGSLEGWMDAALAIDAARAARLRAAGYTVHTQTIPASITPKNRLLLGAP
jgi:SAM-dependent methyltransferase